MSPVPVTLDNFDACAIPLDEWNHRAHLTIAWTLLNRYSADEATDRMRRGVQAYNAHYKIETTPTQGYHETLTVAWMRVLASVIRNYGPCGTADEFFASHPHVLSKVMLRLYYTRPRIMSPEARAGWIEPDLAPLPR